MSYLEAFRFTASRSLILAGAALLVTLPGGAQTPLIDRVNGHEVAAGEVLVTLKPAQASAGFQVAASFGGEVVQTVGRSGVLRIRSSELSTSQLLARLAQDARVDWVEPNYIIRADVTTPNDTMFGSLWGLRNTGQFIGGQAGTAGADIKAAEAWDYSLGSRDIAVGVMDTGIDYKHPDLAANVWSAPAPFDITIGATVYHCPAGSHGFNVHGLTCDPLDDGGHGSHVAGTIGAAGNNANGVAGVNWKTSMVAIKMLNPFGFGTEAEAVNGVEVALQLKAQGVNLRVLNASWGGPIHSTPLRLAMEAARDAGILVVASAGNDSADLATQGYYPGAFATENIITVAATDNKDELAAFSSFGDVEVDLGAPGVEILSTIPNAGYTFSSGTSMATPHVTGAAALVLSACPTLTMADLRAAIVDNTDFLPTLDGKTVSEGRLNVLKAMTACGAVPQPDFTLSADPVEVSILAPNSQGTTVTLTALHGFSANVVLAVEGLPAGVTASFAPASITGAGSSVLTFTAVAGAAVGTHYVTVTGVGGGKSAATLVKLVITGQDFLIAAAVESLNISRGGTAATQVFINPLAGFSQPVTVSIDSLPPNITAVINPPQVAGGSGSTTITFTAGLGAVKGVYPLVIRGISGLINKAVVLQLVVLDPADFTISVNPNAVSVGLGGSGVTTVTAGALNLFSGSIALDVVGLPGGVTATFAPGAINGSGNSTLTLQASNAALPGVYAMTVRGTSGALVHTANLTLTVLSALPKITMIGPSQMDINTAAGVQLFLEKSTVGGVSIEVTSSNPAVASVNGSPIFVPQGQLSTSRMRLIGNSAGIATITASAIGYQPASFQVQVGAGAPPLNILTNALAGGTTGVFYSQQLQATGGTAPYSWQLQTGTLPLGLSLSPTGLLSGTTNTAVTNLALTVKVTDTSSPVQMVTKNLALTIAAPAVAAAIQVVSGTPQITSLNSPFGATLVAIVRDSGGNPLPGVPVTFTAPALSGASGTFVGGTQTIVVPTSGVGLASAAIVANGLAGTFSVNATVAGVATPAVFSLTNAAMVLPAITVQATPSISVGGAARIAIFLAEKAPAEGVTLTLSANNGNGVLPLTSVFVPGGQSTSARASLTGVAPGSVTVTVSGPGYTAGSATVQVNP